MKLGEIFWVGEHGAAVMLSRKQWAHWGHRLTVHWGNQVTVNKSEESKVIPAPRALVARRRVRPQALGKEEQPLELAFGTSVVLKLIRN